MFLIRHEISASVWSSRRVSFHQYYVTNFVASLAEDDPEVVKIMLHWMKHNELRIAKESLVHIWDLEDKDNTRVLKTESGLLIQLYVLADKYGIEKLRNDAIDILLTCDIEMKRAKRSAWSTKNY